MKKICSFRGEYAFLSNMYNSPINIAGHVYTCAEAVFQSAKIADRALRHSTFAGLSGIEARRVGRRVAIRNDWNNIRDDVMVYVIRLKFKNPVLRQKLLETGNAYLVEENTWGDTYWGVCNGNGLNKLGKILMAERKRLAEE